MPVNEDVPMSNGVSHNHPEFRTRERRELVAVQLLDLGCRRYLRSAGREHQSVLRPSVGSQEIQGRLNCFSSLVGAMVNAVSFGVRLTPVSPESGNETRSSGHVNGRE